MAQEQRTQNHDAAFVGQKFRRRDVEFFKNETRETLEGQNVESRVTVQRIIGEQLAFKLEGGLFGREKNERRAFGIFFQCVADFGEAAEGFAAAGGSEKKARLHDLFSRKGAKAQRNFITGCFGKSLADTVESPTAWLQFHHKFFDVRHN
jgi:hypothetical protein